MDAVLVLGANGLRPVWPQAAGPGSGGVQAATHATGSRQAQAALARWCAQAALREAMDTPGIFQLLAGPHGEPRVFAGSVEQAARVTLAHSSRVAAACAWPGATGYSLGIDLERVRLADLPENEYAFSFAERRLWDQSGAGSLPLAAWTVKEAAWKALVPNPRFGPETVEIVEFDASKGWALVRTIGLLSKLEGGQQIRAKFIKVAGPDGDYWFALAAVLSDGSVAGEWIGLEALGESHDWSTLWEIKLTMTAARS